MCVAQAFRTARSQTDGLIGGGKRPGDETVADKPPTDTTQQEGSPRGNEVGDTTTVTGSGKQDEYYKDLQ